MKLFYFISFLCCLTGVKAQRALVLIRKDFIVSRFSEGDHIRLKLKGDNSFISSKITGIHSNFIKLGELDTIYADRIAVIDLRHHSNNNFKIASSGQKLIAAGVILILTDVLTLNPSNKIHEGILITSITLVGTGLILQFVNNNYFKVGKRKKVTIMGSTKH